MESNLEKLARLLTDLNIGVQLESSVATLESMKLILDYDPEVISKAEKNLVVLASQEYWNAINKVFLEGYAYLPEEYVSRFIGDLEYQKSLEENKILISSALLEVASRFNVYE